MEVFFPIAADVLRFGILLASCHFFFHGDFLQDFKPGGLTYQAAFLFLSW